LYKTEPFTITAFYEHPQDVPQLDQEIGTWQVQGVTKPADADYRVVQVKLQIDQNGVFNVRKALYEELAPPEPEEDGPMVEEPVSPFST
jgi:hypothetical protein